MQLLCGVFLVYAHGFFEGIITGGGHYDYTYEYDHGLAILQFLLEAWLSSFVVKPHVLYLFRFGIKGKFVMRPVRINLNFGAFSRIHERPA